MASTQNALTFSPARPEHEATIRTLSGQTNLHHAALLPHAFKPENRFQSHLIDLFFCSETGADGAPFAEIICAFEGDVLQGYVTILTDETPATGKEVDALIADIAILPERRGQGIGKALLAHLCDRMSDTGWASLTADVWRDNQASHEIFAANGFHVERTQYRLGTPVSSPETLEDADRWGLWVMICGALFLVLLGVGVSIYLA